jgi:hypothetical protein
VKDLRDALEVTARQARAVRADGLALVEDLLATGGSFPQRLHLVEPLVCFYADFNRLLLRWCEDTLAEVETWPDTQDIGLTPAAESDSSEWSPTKTPDAWRQVSNSMGRLVGALMPSSGFHGADPEVIRGLMW